MQVECYCCGESGPALCPCDECVECGDVVYRPEPWPSVGPVCRECRRRFESMPAGVAWPRTRWRQ